MEKRIEEIKVVWEYDEDPDTSYLDQKGFEERKAEFQADQFTYIGCRAVATVSYPINNGHRRLERLSSGGLWGIESDMDSEYLHEVEQEELQDLKSHLEAFGVDVSDFDEHAEGVGEY